MSSSYARPIVTWDFVRSFPHKVWVSNWSADDFYPNGFRYMCFSTKDDGEDSIEAVVFIEEPGEVKTERKRIYVKPARFNEVVEGFLRRLEQRFGIEFECRDFSRLKTAEEFAAAIREFGWHSV